MLLFRLTVLEEGKNLLRNASSNSSHVVMESLDSSANHLTASLNKGNGNNRKTDYFLSNSFEAKW